MDNPGQPAQEAQDRIAHKQGLDLPDAAGVDAAAPAGTRSAQAHQLVRSFRPVATAGAVATQLAADRARCTFPQRGDGPDDETGLVQDVNAVSFMQVQAA